MRNKFAFTLVEILTVVTIIGLLAAVGFPLFYKSMQNSKDHKEKANIAKIEAAKDQWAFENQKTNGSEVSWGDISNYMGNISANFTNLDVDGVSIDIGKIGTPASYTNSPL